jgi:ANTAR domain/PAS fold
MSGTDIVARKLWEMGTNAAFQAVDAPYVILDRQLVIRAVNHAYAKVTMREAEELQDQYLFDAFPDNPDDPNANGVTQLGASLEHVLRQRSRHRMRLQRYDVEQPYGRGRFVKKMWLPVNSPIVEDDSVIGIVHHVEDVTDLHLLEPSAEPPQPESSPASAGPPEVSAILFEGEPARRSRTATDTAGLLLRCLQALHETQEAHRSCEHDAAMLRIALQNSRDIGTALGILMNRHKITRDTAFDLLRSASQRSNRKVRDLAHEVIETGTLL